MKFLLIISHDGKFAPLPNLDAAVALAATHPMAKAATIEVRPVWEDLV